MGKVKAKAKNTKEKKARKAKSNMTTKSIKRMMVKDSTNDPLFKFSH